MRSIRAILALFLFAAGSSTLAADLRLFVLVDGVLDKDVDYFMSTVVPNVTTKAFASIPGATGSLIVESKYLRSTAIGVSQIGLVYNGDRTRCYFDYDADVLARIHKHAQDVKFQPDRYLVILAGNAGSGGCADGTTMFIRESTPRAAVIHEMGHSLAGLFDEYGLSADLPLDCVSWRNCSTDAVKTPWTQGGLLAAFPACDGFIGGMFHPAETCLMHSTLDGTFCPVCQSYLSAALSGNTNDLSTTDSCRPDREFVPWTKARGAKEGLDVVAVLEGRHGIRVLDAKTAEMPLRSQVVTGDAFAVARLGGTIIGVAPLSLDGELNILTARSFSHAMGSYELRVPRNARLVRFTLIGVTKADILQPGPIPLDLRLQWLEDARESFVLDDQTVGNLSAAPSAWTYDLGAVLTIFLQ